MLSPSTRQSTLRFRCAGTRRADAHHFGSTFGDDYFLANYKQISSYWRTLDRESDRPLNPHRHNLSSIRRWLRLWFTFEDRVGRREYFFSGVALAALKYVGDVALVWAATADARASRAAR